MCRLFENNFKTVFFRSLVLERGKMLSKWSVELHKLAAIEVSRSACSELLFGGTAVVHTLVGIPNL